MSEFSNHDEELEQFKRWWKESGQQIVIFVALAVAGYFGWQTWQNHQTAKAEAGFSAYSKLQEAVQVSNDGLYDEDQKNAIVHLAVGLKDGYAGSQYAHYAGLILAKVAYENNDAELAIKELNQVVENADDGLAQIARLRLARIQAEQSGADAGLAVIEGHDLPGFSVNVNELKGDLFHQKGDVKQAHKHYKLAIDALDSGDQLYLNVLQSKLNGVTVDGKTTDDNIIETIEEQG